MTTTTPAAAAVRQWARDNGLEVGARGRLAPAVLAAYVRAHGGGPPLAPAVRSVRGGRLAPAGGAGPRTVAASPRPGALGTGLRISARQG